MAKYAYDQSGKSALRSAITSHTGWQALKSQHNLSSAYLSTDLMETLAETLGIDCSQFGKEKGNAMRYGGNWNNTPKPKTISPDIMIELNARFDAVHGFMTDTDRVKFREIYNTVTLKQDGWATEKQHSVLLAMIIRAESAHSGPSPVTLPSPEPVAQTTIHPASVSDPVQAAMAILQGALQQAQQAQQPALDEDRIIAMIKQYSNVPAIVHLNLHTPTGIQTTKDVLLHWRMPLLLAALQANVNIMLVGPAGTGKTHACKLAAELLGLPFKFTGAIDSPYKLTGFVDAQGRTVKTPFRSAVENGGVFLQDEADACLPGALLPINAVASNGLCDFPDAIIQAHPDFRLVMACNTFGRGADRQYVGRNQQDAAVLDRYAVLTWDVDPRLEAGLLGLPCPANALAPVTVAPVTDPQHMQHLAALWLERVQSVRGRIEKHKVRHVVSPRASVMGAKLLQAGWAWSEVEDACIFKGIDADTRAKIAA